MRLAHSWRSPGAIYGSESREGFQSFGFHGGLLGLSCRSGTERRRGGGRLRMVQSTAPILDREVTMPDIQTPILCLKRDQCSAQDFDLYAGDDYDSGVPRVLRIDSAASMQ